MGLDSPLVPQVLWDRAVIILAPIKGKAPSGNSENVSVLLTDPTNELNLLFHPTPSFIDVVWKMSEIQSFG